MIDQNEVWEKERAFWLDGSRFYAANLHNSAMMVFPDPAGIIAGSKILEAVKGAPRWDNVDMTARTFRQISENVIIIAYRAHAARSGKAYNAICSSTYVEEDGVLKLFQHQQTPFTA